MSLSSRSKSVGCASSWGCCKWLRKQIIEDQQIQKANTRIQRMQKRDNIQTFLASSLCPSHEHFVHTWTGVRVVASCLNKYFRCVPEEDDLDQYTKLKKSLLLISSCHYFVTIWISSEPLQKQILCTSYIYAAPSYHKFGPGLHMQQNEVVESCSLGMNCISLHWCKAAGCPSLQTVSHLLAFWRCTKCYYW